MLLLLLLLLLLGISLLGSRLLDRRHPPDGRFMEVGKARIRYNDNGEGTAIVCLHRASSNARDMEASIAPLLAGNFRVVTVDRPGLGHSTRSGPGWWSPLDQANADDLCCLNDYLKENSREYGRIRHPLLAIIGDHDRVVSNEIHTLALNRQAFPQQE